MLFRSEGEKGAEQMQEIMQGLRAPIDSFAEKAWENAERTDYLYDETGLPKSDVLSFQLADGRKIIVRPSGTEPKLKAYLFASGKGQAEAENALDELEEMTNAHCKV